MPKTKKQELFLIALAYCVAGIFYAFSTPPLEASDGYKHYPFVQYVENNWQLPVLDPDDPGRWLQEAAQPPLYYILMAVLTFPVDTTDLAEIHQVNPHSFVGDPNQVGNKNLLIHEPEEESFPWTGSILAIYLIRLASIGLGVGTILVVFRLGALVFNERFGLMGAALTAFNPMFLFVSAAVNNDSLAILLGHAGLFLLVKIWLDVPEPRTGWRRYLLLGIILGLGLLTKLSLGGLLVLAGVALAWKAWQKKRPQIFFVGGPLILVPALLISAAWFWRNWQLYEDPTALNVFLSVADARLRPITWTDWVGEFGTFYRSFWGLFGGVNIAPPELFYYLYNLLAGVGTAGFLAWLWKRRYWFVDKGVWLLVGWPVLLFLLLLRWNINTAAFQGRLIFPGLGAVNLLWAAGLLYLAQLGKVKRGVAVGLPAAALLIALILPWATIRPAYRHPEPLAVLPEGTAFGPISFQDGEGEIRLVGVEMASGQRTEPGGSEPIEVVLYWELVKPVSKDYLSTVHLLGRDNRSVGHVNRYPARGMIPTSQWQAGQIWRDVYTVYVNQDAEAPARLRVLVSLYDAKAEADVPAVGPDGSAIELIVVGEAGLAAAEGVVLEPERPLEATFGDNIAFLGYELSPSLPAAGEMLNIVLYWRADGRPALDYTVFVQLLDAAGNQLAGADGPPVNGDFPTGWWRNGDMVKDSHLMQLPEDIGAGDYSLLIGLYDPQTGQRLPRMNGQGDSIRIPVTIGP